MQYVYSKSGKALGFIHGKHVHAISGKPLGQVHGTHVHKLDGEYVGELYDGMIVDQHLEHHEDIGDCGMPKVARSRRNPANRGRRDCAYRDVFDRLISWMTVTVPRHHTGK